MNAKLLVIAILSIPIISFSQKKDKYLIAKNYFAGVTASSTINDLYNYFGEDNVKEDIDYGPEGNDSIPVTTVFTDTHKEFVIFWKEGKFHQQPGFIQFSNAKAPYKTAQGISVGTSLQTLIDKNKTIIEFIGFSWDYGGIITSFKKGKLENNYITYTLEAKGQISDKIMGDITLTTDMPIVKKYLTKISVQKITLHF